MKKFDEFVEEAYLRDNKQTKKLMDALNNFSKWYTFEIEENVGGVNVYEKRTGKLIGSYPDIDEIMQSGLR